MEEHMRTMLVFGEAFREPEKFKKGALPIC